MSRFRGRSISVCALLLASSLACDAKEEAAKLKKQVGATPDAAPAAKEGDPAPGATAGASDSAGTGGALISETALCEHILSVAHEELGHLDEFDPDVETEAVRRCAKAAAEDRERYGPVFDGLALCVDAATTLKEIGSCEDRYTRLLAGDLDEAHRLALDEPIVDSELCAHARKVTGHEDEDEAAANATCVEKLQRMRDDLGNLAIDEMAACVMKATDEPGVQACTAAAEARTKTAAPDPEVVKQAIEALQELVDAACACKDESCADEAMKELEAWVEKYEEADGSDADEKTVEEMGSKLAECLIAAKGAGGAAAEDGKKGEKVEKTEAAPGAAGDSKAAVQDPLG